MPTLKRTGRCQFQGRIYTGRIEDDWFLYDGGRAALNEVSLLAPCTPSKIIGIGRNYADHVAEMQSELPREPLLFFKPPSAVNHHEGEIIYPRVSSRVDYEGELAVVIGIRCREVPKENAFSVIAGFTICNDVTARDLQHSDGQWARAKGFDTFAPLGPWIVSGLNPSGLRLRTTLNGEVRQDSDTSKLIFDIPTLVEYVSRAFTLEAGDVISTGTPSGVGPMGPGDIVQIEIEGIGVLRNKVVAPQE